MRPTKATTTDTITSLRAAPHGYAQQRDKRPASNAGLAVDDLPPDERAAAGLAARLWDSGNLHPLIAQLRNGEIGPNCARDALRVLAELDVELLVQMTLDGLISAYLEYPGLAQTKGN
jgi:hypothetical protein